MSEDAKEKPVKNRYPDRFTVEPANLEKLGRLLDQFRTSVQGGDASRKDILNWLIEKFPDELSAADLKELSAQFYDEERFLRLALEEVRAAKLRGERVTLEEILQRKTNASATCRRGPRQKRAAPHNESRSTLEMADSIESK